MFKKIIYGIFYIVLLFMIIPFVAVNQFMNSYTDGIKELISQEKYDEILKYESSFYDSTPLYENEDTTNLKLFINDIYMLNQKEKETDSNSYTRYIQFRFININKENMLLGDEDTDLSLIRLTFTNNIREKNQSEEDTTPLNTFESSLLFNTYKDSNFLINQLCKVDEYRDGTALEKVEIYNAKGILILTADNLDIDFSEDISAEEIEKLDVGMTFNEVFKLYFKGKQITITIVWFVVLTAAYAFLGYFIFRKKSVKYQYVPRNPQPKENFTRQNLENKNTDVIDAEVNEEEKKD